MTLLERGSHPADIGEEVGRRIGVLLAASGEADIVEAAVVLLANDGDEIFTSDPNDLRGLAITASLHTLIPV